MKRLDHKHDILITPIRSMADFEQRYLNRLEEIKQTGLETIG